MRHFSVTTLIGPQNSRLANPKARMCQFSLLQPLVFRKYAMVRQVKMGIYDIISSAAEGRRLGQGSTNAYVGGNEIDRIEGRDQRSPPEEYYHEATEDTTKNSPDPLPPSLPGKSV